MDGRTRSDSKYEANLQDIAKLVSEAQSEPEKFLGLSLYQAELRAIAACAPATRPLLEALIHSTDAEALDLYCRQADIDALREFASGMAGFKAKPFPAPAILDVLFKHGIKPSPVLFAYHILKHGFLNKDLDYARRAVDQFGLPNAHLRQAIPSLIELASEPTANYLAEIISSAVQDDRSFVTSQLLGVAWGDACPKLMSCLAWLGVLPDEFAMRYSSGDPAGLAIKAHAETLSTAHAIIELRYEFPRLADLLLSDIPVTLRADDDG